MGETTKIEWTNVPGYIGGSWNPWQGCRKKSEGCANCYMYRDKTRFGQDPSKVILSKPPTFNMPMKQQEPHAWFTCSWSDFFNPEADDWREMAWNIIQSTPRHLYMILTKLPERIERCLPWDWGTGYKNVWLGTSVENQRWADRRIPALLKVPAVKRFLSCEPLLGPVDIWSYLEYCDAAIWGNRKIDWVICGGESGSDYRPMDIQWVEDIANQCKAASTPVFVKQDSGTFPGTKGRLPDHLWNLKEFPV